MESVIDNTTVRQELHAKVISVDENGFLPMALTITFDLIMLSPEYAAQSTAVERVQVFFRDVFNKCMVIAENSPLLPKLKKLKTSTLIMETPDVPFEHQIGSLLFNKLQAIVEDVYLVDELTIWGDRGGLSYIINSASKYSDSNEDNRWWNREDLTLSDDKKSPLIELTWEKLGMELGDYLIFDLDEDGELVFTPLEDEPESDLAVTVVDGGAENPTEDDNSDDSE